MSDPTTDPDVEGLDVPAARADPQDETASVSCGEYRVSDVLRRIGNGAWRMPHEFLREPAWTRRRESRLIESVLMRLPLPALHAAEDDAGRTVIIDGVHRLTTLARFLDERFTLELPHRAALHGRGFATLAARLKNRIEDHLLRVHVMRFDTPAATRLEILERVGQATSAPVHDRAAPRTPG